MRRRKLFPILLLFALSILGGASAAEDGQPQTDPVCRFNKWGLTFIVHDMQWIGKGQGSGSGAENGDGPAGTGHCLRMDLEIVNERQGRKLDLEDDLSVFIQDEFGNQFFPLKDAFIKKRISLYPREGLRRVVHFEPLLAESRLLKLCLSGIPPQRSQSLSFLLPPRRLQNLVASGPLDFPDEKDLLVTLVPGKKYYLAGQSVRLALRFPDGVMKPHRIFVVTPNQLLEDEQLLMEYQVNIPVDQPPGVFTVVVMAKWGGEDDGYLVSRSIDLRVRDPWEAAARRPRVSGL